MTVWMKRDEAAHYTGANVRYLDQLRQSSSGPAYHKVGKKILYLQEDLDEWVEAMRMAELPIPTRPVPLAERIDHDTLAYLDRVSQDVAPARNDQSLPAITVEERERIRQMRDGNGESYSEQGFTWKLIATTFRDSTGRQRRLDTLRAGYLVGRAIFRALQEKAA